MRVIHIDFKEFEPGTYEAVRVSRQASDTNPALELVEIFSTGDPTADFRAAIDSLAGETRILSSSIDHFITDDPEASKGIKELLDAV